MSVAISHPCVGKKPHVNFTAVTIGAVTYWFSYATCVGFLTDGVLIVRENEWGPTTGKHLNFLDGGDKRYRLSGDDFAARLATVQEAKR